MLYEDAMKRGHGFTFIEIIVVLAVLALLAGITVPMVDLLLTRSRETATREEIQRIGAAIIQFRQDTGLWPNNLDQMANAHYLSPGMWNEDFKHDAWLNEYQLVTEENLLYLYSYGSDETDNSHAEGLDIVLIIDTNQFAGVDTKSKVAVMAQGLLAYYDDCNTFPDDPTQNDCEHLRQLVANTFGQSGWAGPYVELTYPELCFDGYNLTFEYQLGCVGGSAFFVCLVDSEGNSTTVNARSSYDRKRDYTLVRLDVIDQAIIAYFSDLAGYPPDLDALLYSPTPVPLPPATPLPTWNGPYVAPHLIMSGDAWTNSYLYKQPTVYSAGPNGIDESSPPAFGGDDVYLPQ